MNIAAQIALYRGKGFTEEHAEVIAFMRLAAGVLFRAFPESFLLFGGATLLLFHDSPRHSGDLDLLSVVSGYKSNICNWMQASGSAS